MTRYADLMASTGEFTDDHGRKAKRMTRCGVIMRDDVSGKMSIKLDCVPVAPGWSGWLAVRHVEKENPASLRPAVDGDVHQAEENQDQEIAT